jgi:hypothetical protein
MNDSDGAGKSNKPRSKGSKKRHRRPKSRKNDGIGDAVVINRLDADSDGSPCWRAGMDCTSSAENFACCGSCLDGICV